MTPVKNGDRVVVEYTARLLDGTVFDSTSEEAFACEDECDADEHATGDCGCGCATGPMEMVVGQNQLFPKIDEALVGMVPGEKKTVAIPAADGFGEFDEGKVFTVTRENLPEDFDPEVGEEMVLSNEDDEEIGVTVLEKTTDGYRFDANHPLAGEDLSYELQLLEILP